MKTRRIIKNRTDESRKVTLTLGQLKRLVRESDEGDFEIENGVLYSYNGNDENVVIPEGVVDIDNAFGSLNGKNMVSLTLPASLKHIDCDGLADCRRLREVHISDLSAYLRIDFGTTCSNPVYTARHLFLNGKEIRDLVIPSDIKEIKPDAFHGCTGLVSVKIPEGVETIGAGAFGYCFHLKIVSIPESAKEIDWDAFSGCSLIQTIYVANDDQKEQIIKRSQDLPKDCFVIRGGPDGGRREVSEDKKVTLTLGQLKRLVRESGDSLYSKLRAIQDKDDDAEVPYNEKGRRPYFTCRVYDSEGELYDEGHTFLDCIGFHVLDNAIEAANEYLSENEGDFVEIYEETEREEYGIVGEPELVWSSER